MKPRILSTAHLACPLASTIATLLAAFAAHAADGDWLGTDGNWADVATWNGGTIADGSGFTANFIDIDIEANKTITLTAPQTIGNITFTDAITASHNLTISGDNTLTLAGTPLINVTDTDRTLTISSVVDGTAGLNKTGTGILCLSNANTYTGTTTVTKGLLKLDHANALPGGVGTSGGTGNLSFNGGVIGLTSGFSRSIGSSDNQVQWNNQGGGFAAFGGNRIVNFGGAGAFVKWSSAGGTDRFGGGMFLSDSTATHTVTIANSFDFLNGNRTITVADGAAEIDAVLSGSLHNGGTTGRLTKNGLGTLVITGAYPNYASNSLPTTVNAGVLSIGGAGWLGYATNTGAISIATGAIFNHNSSANQTLSGVISGGGVITKTGTGTLTLTGANTYGGNITVSAGTLTLSNAPDAANANSGNDASAVTISTSATLNLTYTGTDKVDKLFIGTAQKAPGIYGKTDSVSPIIGIPQITGDGTLTVANGPANSNYASWASDPMKGNIPGEPASGDFDNDGITNLVEYALGMNPRISSQPSGVLLGNTITYPKGTDAIANGDVAWVIETSTDLGLADDWTPAVSQPAGDPNFTISHTFTPGNPVINFARLRVTGP